MIEDKKLGLRIAENKDEKIWGIIQNQYDKQIKEIKSSIKANKDFLKKTDRKIARDSREVTKQRIKGLNEELKIQKAFKEFIDNKIIEVQND